MTDKDKINIRQDPFVLKLLSNLPDNVRDTFTDDQLYGVKSALAAKSWGKHPIDFRGNIGFGKFKYYFVFLAGENRRSTSRLREKAFRAIEALVVTIVIGSLILLGLYLLIVLLLA